MANSYQLSVVSYQLTEVARQALDSGILSEATRIRTVLRTDRRQTDYEDKEISIEPNGSDIIQLKGEEVLESLESSWREVGAEETLIITRSNKLTNLYNQGVRARILWKEEDLSNGDRIMVTKNNYFWATEYEDLEFLANGDMFEVERLSNCHELYGFHFGKASLRSVDYNWEIEALVWLDTLTTDSPEANYGMQKELFAIPVFPNGGGSRLVSTEIWVTEIYL